MKIFKNTCCVHDSQHQQLLLHYSYFALPFRKSAFHVAFMVKNKKSNPIQSSGLAHGQTKLGTVVL
jgi:hypothetical protein